MKKLILFSCILLFSCNNKIHYDGQEFDNYDQYVEYSINQLKSPVVITNIRSKFYSSDTIYSIVVKDANNIIKEYDSQSELIDIIAKTKDIGDTIR